MFIVSKLHHDEVLTYPEDWEATLILANAFGWQPAGTTPPPRQYASNWGGTYHCPGTTIEPRDALEFAVALRKAWRAFKNGEPERELWQTNNRLTREVYRRQGPWRPLEALRKSPPESQGRCWAVMIQLTRGGAFEISNKGVGKMVTATVRMLGGVNWTDGKTLAKGEVVQLPLHEAGLFLARGKAEEMDGAEAAA